MLLERNIRYKATVRLDGFQVFASNFQVAEKFEEIGFRDVTVTGDGDTRHGEGTWDRDDQDVDLSSLPIRDVKEV